jgi:predicted amidohydrolase
VPSCTDAAAGYHRVRVACQARALENQCYHLGGEVAVAKPS